MRGSGTLEKIAVALLGIKPVPAWLDARLNYAYKQRFKASKTGNAKLLDWADREIAKLRELGGL